MKITMVIVAIEAKVQSGQCFSFYAFVIKALENLAPHQICFTALKGSEKASGYVVWSKQMVHRFFLILFS